MTVAKKGWGKWLVALLVVALLAWGLLRTLSARKQQAQQLAETSAARDTLLVELAASDVVKAKTLNIVLGLPISGSLKAVNSAIVKARVAGELRGLTVREGDFVKAGQVIARIDASEYQSRVRQAQNQADSAKAQVEVVQRQYDNNKALVDQGFISRTSLETSLANLNAAQATYKAALAATEISAKSVDDTVLRAPIAGQVSQRLSQAGERVGIDARIIEIVDVSRLELEATLAATDSTQLRLGQTAELKIEGSPQPVTARVVRINPSAQAGSRSVLAYLSLDNPGSPDSMPLRQGLFAQGTLGISSSALLAVPLASVRIDKPAPYVQTIENGKVQHKAVEQGARGLVNGEMVVAVKGLLEGTQVIRGNVGAIREGMPVRFTAAGSALPAKTAP
ncbi:MAG: efflux RND transporter periplasmic adaptor subunit [Pseudomonadota bacterium]